MSATAPDDGIKQVSLPSLMLLLSGMNGLLRRDNQHLTRIDFIGMRQHRFIGFKNTLIIIGRAIHRFGDSAQGVTGFDRVKTTFRPALRHLNAVTDLTYASDIPDCYQNFFLILLRSNIASDRGGAIVRNINIDLFGARQIKTIDMFFSVYRPALLYCRRRRRPIFSRPLLSQNLIIPSFHTSSTVT